MNGWKLAIAVSSGVLVSGCAVHRYEVAHVDPVAPYSDAVWGTFSIGGDVDGLGIEIQELRKHLNAAGVTEIEGKSACIFSSRHISITTEDLRPTDIRRYVAEYSVLLIPTWYLDQPKATFTFEELIGCSPFRTARYVEHHKSLDWLPVIPVALAVRRYRVGECLVAEGMVLNFLGTASTGYEC